MHTELKWIMSLAALSMLGFTALAQTTELKWKVFPADEKSDGSRISLADYKVTNAVDAVVPRTVFYSYVKAGKEKDPDYADNIYQVDTSKYNRPFWYRSGFKTPPMPKGKHLWLNFNGINKRAEVYFNGRHIGTLKGLMERGIYDVTQLLKADNAIAVLIVPPKNDPDHNHALANWESPTYIGSAGWDWNPSVPGYNSGITETIIYNIIRFQIIYLYIDNQYFN